MEAIRQPLHKDDRSDEDLMLEVAAEKQNALGPLYARYAPLVYHLASQTLGSGAAEDIVQEVFVAVWRRAETFDPKRGTFRSWVLQIAHFRILNELRRRSRRPQLEPETNDEFLDGLPDDNAEPIETAWREYRAEAIRAAVDRLPPSQRQALRLAFFEDLTHNQVAEMLELPLGTVKTRIRSGLQTLRANLTPIGITVALIGILGILGVRYQIQQEAFQREVRAIQMVTMSDVTATHVPAASDAPQETHGSYRTRPGSSIAVLALHSFPQSPNGKTYQGWVFHQDTWISLSTAIPDADGNALLIGENPGLVALPDVIQVTLEPAGGSPLPTGPVIIILQSK